jgi:hypothetical protein
MFIGWLVFSGFRTGNMRPVHWGFETANRSDQPKLFWFYTAVNTIFVAGGAFAVVEMWVRTA